MIKRNLLNLSEAKAIGRQVRRCRVAAAITQEVTAKRSGIYRTYLSRIESGAANPTVTVLSAIAKALDVELQEFFQNPQEA